LPALPALAMLAATWLAADARTRLVDAVVAAGLLGMALMVGAFFLKQQIDDSWKTAKMAVTQYQLLNTDKRPLLLMGDLPYSASFYSQGKAKAVKDNAELATRVAQERLFVALNPDQVQALTPELRIRLQLEATSGAYSLYSSILN